MAQTDSVEEGALELLPDSVIVDGKRLEELLMKHLRITQTGKRIRLGRARISIEWLEEGYWEVLQAGQPNSLDLLVSEKASSSSSVNRGDS